MRNPSANAVCITTSARPETIIETCLAPPSSAWRSAVVTTAFASASRRDCQRTDMTLGGDVGIAGGAARVLDPDRARREAAEQKLVMQISAESEQLLIDPASPFASASRPFARFRTGRNRCDVETGIARALRDDLRRRGDAIE